MPPARTLAPARPSPAVPRSHSHPLAGTGNSRAAPVRLTRVCLVAGWAFFCKARGRGPPAEPPPPRCRPPAPPPTATPGPRPLSTPLKPSTTTHSSIYPSSNPPIHSPRAHLPSSPGPPPTPFPPPNRRPWPLPPRPSSPQPPLPPSTPSPPPTTASRRPRCRLTALSPPRRPHFAAAAGTAADAVFAAEPPTPAAADAAIVAPTTEAAVAAVVPVVERVAGAVGGRRGRGVGWALSRIPPPRSPPTVRAVVCGISRAGVVTSFYLYITWVCHLSNVPVRCVGRARMPHGP